MKKKIFMFAMMFVTVFMGSVVLSSCGDDDNGSSIVDDDDNNGGDISFGKFDDMTFKTPYAYWYLYDGGDYFGDKKIATLQFTSYDMKSQDQNIDNGNYTVWIEFILPDDEEEINSMVFGSGKYRIWMDIHPSADSDFIMAETDYAAQGNSDLKITRKGDTYTISIEKATVMDSNQKEHTFSFKYTGSLNKLQQ